MASTSPADNLTSKTNNLTSQVPIDPSQAKAAQIPLQNFTIPTFPPSTFSAGLTSLILTSDIKPDEYPQLLLQQDQGQEQAQPLSPIPDLPSSIQSLTLELFSLGYPPGFLTSLGDKLPNLKALTIYSQLFAGTTSASRGDALAFIKSQVHLQELHLLDVFGPLDFFTDLGDAVPSPGLKFLEVNYTYRHSDPQFLRTVPKVEVGSMVKRGLVGCTLSISSPDVSVDDEDDREGTEIGVLLASSEEGAVMVGRITDIGAGLVMCDLTMFELGVSDLEKVVDALHGAKILGLAVTLEDGWDGILDVIGKNERTVEVLELVGVPGMGLVEQMKGGEEVELKGGHLELLSERCKELRSVKVSILRTKVEQWAREEGTWIKVL